MSDQMPLSTQADPLVRGYVLLFGALCMASVGAGGLAQNLREESPDVVQIAICCAVLVGFPLMIFGLPYFRYWSVRKVMKENAASGNSSVLAFSALDLVDESDGNGLSSHRIAGGWIICRAERIEIFQADSPLEVFYSIPKRSLVEANAADVIDTLLALPTFKLRTIDGKKLELIPIFTDFRDIYGYRKWLLVRLGRKLMSAYGERTSQSSPD